MDYQIGDEIKIEDTQHLASQAFSTPNTGIYSSSVDKSSNAYIISGLSPVLFYILLMVTVFV